MGILGKANEKAKRNQGESIVKEAAVSNSKLVEMVDLLDTQDQAGAAFDGMLTAFLGGKSKASAVQMFRFENRSIRHFYFQPYEGMTVMPGEHHMLLDGVVMDALVLKKMGMAGRKQWVAATDISLSEAYNGSAALRNITKRVEWEWAAGFAKIDLKWTVQIRPAGNGKTHLMMQTGRYGGLTTYQVGFNVFLNLAATFMKVLQPGEGVEQPFVVPTAFGDVFAAANADK